MLFSCADVICVLVCSSSARTIDSSRGSVLEVPVLLGNGGPLVNTVLDEDEHTTLSVVVDVAVEQPRTRVGDVVTDGSPGRASLSRRSHDSIQLGRVVQVEQLRSGGDGLVDGVPLEGALAGADVVHLVAVLVDRVRRHRAGGLEDEIDPGIVEGRDGDIVLDEGLGIEEGGHSGLVDDVGHETGVVQSPEVRSTVEAHVKSPEVVGLERDGLLSPGNGGGVVEEDNIGAEGGTDNAEMRVRVNVASIGTAHPEDSVSDEGLRSAGRGDTDLEGADGALGLNEDRDTVAVEEVEGLDPLRDDICTVDSVHPHIMLVDGDSGNHEVVGTDEVNGDPRAHRGADNLNRTHGACAALEDLLGHQFRGTRVTGKKVHDLGGNATLVSQRRARNSPEPGLLCLGEACLQFLLRNALDAALAIEDDRVIAGHLSLGEKSGIPLLVGGEVSQVRDDQRPAARLGGLKSADGTGSNGAEGLGVAAAGTNLDGTVQTILNVATVVGVVPVAAVLGSRPGVGEGLTRHDVALGHARNTIRPRGAVHLNAVEVDGSVLGRAVLDNDINRVTLIDINDRAGRGTVDENHLTGDTILGNVTKGQLEVEGPLCGSSRQKLGQQGHSGGELHDGSTLKILLYASKTKTKTLEEEVKRDKRSLEHI
jgi:hypothetical protein